MMMKLKLNLIQDMIYADIWPKHWHW